MKFHSNVILSLCPGQYFKERIHAKYKHELRIPFFVYLTTKCEVSYLTTNSVAKII